MSKKFQINEEDLATLEHILPQFCDDLYVTMNNRQRSQFRQVQDILKNVRWNYGPPLEVEVIPADE